MLKFLKKKLTLYGATWDCVRGGIQIGSSHHAHGQGWARQYSGKSYNSINQLSLPKMGMFELSKLCT